jgi:hypothetical protein
MATVQILDARKFPSRDPLRSGKLDTMIIYMLDKARDNTHVAFVAGERPSDAEIQAAIRADQAQRDTIKAKTFTI